MIKLAIFTLADSTSSFSEQLKANSLQLLISHSRKVYLESQRVMRQRVALSSYNAHKEHTHNTYVVHSKE